MEKALGGLRKLRAGVGDGALIGRGIYDQPCDVLQVVVVANELASEPGEELGVSGRAAFPVFDGFDDATAHQLLPDTVGDDLSEDLRNKSMQHYIERHPEKELLAYMQGETANWLTRIVPEDSDKYVMMAAWNIVNCIAFVPMAAPKTTH